MHVHIYMSDIYQSYVLDVTVLDVRSQYCLIRIFYLLLLIIRVHPNKMHKK